MAIKKATRHNIQFVKRMKAKLPPIIARKEVVRLLGGIVSPQTLSNADRAGQGPGGAYRVGKLIIYPTDALLNWIVDKYGVTAIDEMKEAYKPSAARVKKGSGKD